MLCGELQSPAFAKFPSSRRLCRQRAQRDNRHRGQQRTPLTSRAAPQVSLTREPSRLRCLSTSMTRYKELSRFLPARFQSKGKWWRYLGSLTTSTQADQLPSKHGAPNFKETQFENTDAAHILIQYFIVTSCKKPVFPIILSSPLPPLHPSLLSDPIYWIIIAQCYPKMGSNYNYLTKLQS